MSLLTVQPLVLAPVPPAGVFLSFDVAVAADVRSALNQLVATVGPEQVILGCGEPLARALGVTIPGLRPFPRIETRHVTFPATQSALWVFAPGDTPGACFDVAEAVEALVAPTFRRCERVETFRYREGRDLSGYIDGTANPEGEGARAAVTLTSAGPGLDGGTFVAVQRWQHDLTAWRTRTEAERDSVIGRRISDNDEIEGAPASAHVKRTETESFDPPSPILRRSMPWSHEGASGLYFVAFANSLTPYESMLRRMAGCEDDLPDALLTLSRPLGGSYHFCPPVKAARFDLRALTGA